MQQANKDACNMCFNSGCSCVTCLLYMPINAKRPYNKKDVVVCTECGLSHNYNDWEYEVAMLCDDYYELLQFYQSKETQNEAN